MRRIIRRNDFKPFRPRRKENSQAVPRSSNRSRFVSVPIENNGLRVSGYDMVYDMTQIEVDPTSGAFVTIPANPAYWTGTRVAQLACAYSQYRPIYLRFDYFPSVSMQDSGTVTSGTIWNEAPSSNSLSQALTTSNAGKTHTVWTRTRSRIRVGTNLDQNLYDMSGPFDADTNPFIFLAVVNDTERNRVPGYYMCQYTFEFKNPIGDGNEYEHEIVSAGDIEPSDVWESTSGVLRSESAGFAPGTVVTVQVIAGVVQFLLKGSRLGVAADMIFDLFKSRNKRSTSAAISDETGYIYSYNSGVAGINRGYYTISNAEGVITRSMFYKANQVGVSTPIYGWCFKLSDNQDGTFELTPYYFRNKNWTDEDFEDPTDASTMKYYVIKGFTPDNIEMSSIVTGQNASNLYQTVSDSYFASMDDQYHDVDIILIDRKGILVRFPDSEDEVIVGTGQLKMLPRKKLRN